MLSLILPIKRWSRSGVYDHRQQDPDDHGQAPILGKLRVASLK
jgi:hypothetical protein